MIVQIECTPLIGSGAKHTVDVECSDTETCPLSGQPLPIGTDEKWVSIFNNIDDPSLAPTYQILP